MITGLEFDNALKIINSYKLQLENDLNSNGIIGNNRTINIQNDLMNNPFNAIRNYYLIEYNIELKREDLSAMDVGLLAKINYEKLQGYRGLGKIKLYNFKKLMVFHSVISEEEL